MRLSKRKVDKVIRENWRKGFEAKLSGNLVGGLEYASDSGYYAYNPVRHIAESAGAAEADRIISYAIERRGGEHSRDLGGYRWLWSLDDIPAEVVAECYAAARIASEPKGLTR